MVYIPTVSVKENNTEKYYDIYSMLLKDRIIMIGEEITDPLAQVVISELLYLDSQNNEAPIHIYLNTPGGSVNAGLSIVDTMNLVKAPVYTYVTGMAASMGSVIFGAGEKGFRRMLPHSRVMLHQASSGYQGNIQDMEISLEQTHKLNNLLLEMLGDFSGGKTLEEMKQVTQRDYWMTAEESVKFGIADDILGK